MALTFKSSLTNGVNPWKNKAITGDFFCDSHYVIWETSNKDRTLKNVYISFGIRRSDMWQIFPIWLNNNNCQRAIIFGFWKLKFEIGYRY